MSPIISPFKFLNGESDIKSFNSLSSQDEYKLASAHKLLKLETVNSPVIFPFFLVDLKFSNLIIDEFKFLNDPLLKFPVVYISDKEKGYDLLL